MLPAGQSHFLKESTVLCNNDATQLSSSNSSAKLPLWRHNRGFTVVHPCGSAISFPDCGEFLVLPAVWPWASPLEGAHLPSTHLGGRICLEETEVSGPTLVKTIFSELLRGAGAGRWGGVGSWHAWQASSFVQRPTLFRGHPAIPAHKVLHQSSWPSAVENQGRASTLSLRSWEDFTEVLFKLRLAKWLGVVGYHGEAGVSGLYCALHWSVRPWNQAGRRSSCAVARAPGAGSMLLGWCGNASKAPGSRCS